MGVEKLWQQKRLLTGLALRSFSFPPFLSGNLRNGSCRLAEEPHQSLEVLRSCSQKELLPHKLQSPQVQATQPDLIFQFGASTIPLKKFGSHAGQPGNRDGVKQNIE